MTILAPDLSAVRRAQSMSLFTAAAVAVVPTALAAQGMVMVGHDALGLPVDFAVALAAFLELALISSALLARASAMAGRPAGADAVAVWCSPPFLASSPRRTSSSGTQTPQLGSGAGSSTP